MSKIVQEVKFNVYHKWETETDKEEKNKLFCYLTYLYNDWCEYSVQSCEGYLFDITKEDDVCCCIQRGRSLKELAAIENDFVESKKTPFFALVQSVNNFREYDLIHFSNRDDVVKYMCDGDIFEWLLISPEKDHYFPYFYDKFIHPLLIRNY